MIGMRRVRLLKPEMRFGPVWEDLFFRLSMANLGSLVHEPQLLLTRATLVMNEAPIQGWRALRLSLDELSDRLVLSVRVTEHSGTRLNSPREVKMEFDVSELSPDMIVVRDVMDS